MNSEIQSQDQQVNLEEILHLLRGMKNKMLHMERQRDWMAVFAAGVGCPEKRAASCHYSQIPVMRRDTAICAACWKKCAVRETSGLDIGSVH